MSANVQTFEFSVHFTMAASRLRYSLRLLLLRLGSGFCSALVFMNVSTCERCIEWCCRLFGSSGMSRPLALGAGAGSLSSLAVAFLSQQLLSPPETPAVFERYGLDCPRGEDQHFFAIGLLSGILIGVILGGILDLLYLWKQRLTVEVRDRIALLHLKRG